MRTPYDWPADVRKLTKPVMLAYGDSDMVRLDHAARFYQLLGGGLKDAGWGREHMPKHRLAILSDRTHYDVLLAPEAEVAATLPFLEGRTHRQGDLQQTRPAAASKAATK